MYSQTGLLKEKKLLDSISRTPVSIPGNLFYIAVQSNCMDQIKATWLLGKKLYVCVHAHIAHCTVI